MGLDIAMWIKLQLHAGEKVQPRRGRYFLVLTAYSPGAPMKPHARAAPPPTKPMIIEVNAIFSNVIFLPRRIFYRGRQTDRHIFLVIHVNNHLLYILAKLYYP